MWVSVSVRPEKVGPDNGESAANQLTGTLVRRTYLGDLVQYHVVLPGGREIVCQRQIDSMAPDARWEVGALVDLGWDSDSALVLAGEHELVAMEEDLRLLADEDSRL
jgi:hypothetical protein